MHGELTEVDGRYHRCTESSRIDPWMLVKLMQPLPALQEKLPTFPSPHDPSQLSRASDPYQPSRRASQPLPVPVWDSRLLPPLFGEFSPPPAIRMGLPTSPNSPGKPPDTARPSRRDFGPFPAIWDDLQTPPSPIGGPPNFPGTPDLSDLPGGTPDPFQPSG